MAEQFLTLMADLDDDSQAIMSGWYSNLQKAGFTGMQTPGLPYHISLATFPLEKEQEAVALMQKMAAEFSSVPVHISHIGMFAGGKVLFGAPEALVMLAAFLIRTAAGGVLVMNEKLWSAYTVITTGMIMPISFLVRSLNSLVNAMMFTPCWPSAGPTGGAGVALPPGICSLIKPITFCAIVFTNLQPLRGQTEPIEQIFDPSHTQNTYILRSPAFLADYLKK